MKDIFEILRGLDKGSLKEAIKKAQEFSKTEEGKKVIEKLKNGEAVDELPISKDEQSKIISEIKKNPELSKKINVFLNKGE